VSITVGGLDFENAFLHGQDGDIKRSSAKIEDDYSKKKDKENDDENVKEKREEREAERILASPFFLALRP
jgi:hypothetical protein